MVLVGNFSNSFWTSDSSAGRACSLVDSLYTAAEWGATLPLELPQRGAASGTSETRLIVSWRIRAACELSSPLSTNPARPAPVLKYRISAREYSVGTADL